MGEPKSATVPIRSCSFRTSCHKESEQIQGGNLLRRLWEDCPFLEYFPLNLVISETMADQNGVCQVMEETEVDVWIQQTKTEPTVSNNRSTWSNGQCIVAVPAFSALNPSFDLSLCRAKLEREGFEIPDSDMEVPLKTALDVPSVKRYISFNSGLFHFIMAPVLYVVVWCAVFSTLHLYITVNDYWVLCLSVSLVSIFLTTAIIFVLHYSNKKININIDIRLVQVNERMMKHKLLVGLADWVQNCTGNMQLYFVYWDMSPCLRTLTETLEEHSTTTADIQRKLKSRMSHLVLMTEVLPLHPKSGGLHLEEDSNEHRPLLQNENDDCRPPSGQQRDTNVTSSYSLVPDASLPAQAKAYQLLMVYSAAYVKLLVSERLSGPSHRRMRPLRNHCTAAPVCLCQYIRKKILQ